MRVQFQKKCFIGICGILLIIMFVLFNTDSSFYGDPKMIVPWIQNIINSTVFTKDSLTVLKGDNSPVLQKDNSSLRKKDLDRPSSPICLLPLQWTLEMNSSNITKPWTVLHLKENDICLGLLIKKHCYVDKRIVPNVVHYILFGKILLKIYTFLSFLGTWKHIKPCFIVIHGDFPFGPLMEEFLTYKPRIIHINKIPKKRIFGTKLSWIEHKADVARLEIILKYGGIYMDYDEIPLKSLDPLRNYSVVMGQETRFGLGNGLFLAEPSTMFIKIWMATYQSYDPKEWVVHSTLVPFKLAHLLSKMVFITSTFFKPDYIHCKLLYDKNIDCSNFYAIHLYKKSRIENENLETIRYIKNTFGSVARFIYYGNKTLQQTSKPENKSVQLLYP